MGSCPGIKRDGTRCTVVVSGSQTYCYQHDPAYAEKRKADAARAGRAAPNREIRALKDRLAELYENVLEGVVDKGDAAVLVQIVNARRALISLEKDIRMEGELEARIEALEGGRMYG